MPSISNATRVENANLLTSDSLAIDRAGDTTPRRTDIADLDARYSRTAAQLKTALETLTGGDRLAATAVQGISDAVAAATAGDLTGVSLANGVLTFTRRGDEQDDITITLPAGGAATDLVGVSIDGQTLTFTQRGGETTPITLPSGGGGGGLAAVASDATLTGAGTSSSPLKVARPFTAADESKLDAIEARADVTDADNVRDAIRGQTTAAIADSDELPFYDASTSELSRTTASNMRSYMQEGIEQGGGGGGATTFTGLTDTPSALGTAGQIPAVNSGATALEFIDAPSGGGAGGGLGENLLTTSVQIGAIGTSGTTNANAGTLPVRLEEDKWYVAQIQPGSGFHEGVRALRGIGKVFKFESARGEFVLSADEAQGLSDATEGVFGYIRINIVNPSSGNSTISTFNNIPGRLAAQLRLANGLAIAEIREIGAADLSDPTDTWAQQFSILRQFDGRDANTIASGTTTAVEDRVAFASAFAQDEAELGAAHNSGRIQFNNLHATQDSTLRVTGKLRVFRANVPAGRMRVLLRTYDAQDDTVGDDQVLASHSTAAATTEQTFDLPIGDVTAMARRGRTYSVFLEFTPASAVGSNASYGFAADADDANLIAFRHWTADVQSGMGSGGVTIPAKPPNLEGVDTYVRSTLNDDGDTIYSHGQVRNIQSLPTVDDLAENPRHATDKVWLQHAWNGRYPGAYEATRNPVDRNAVMATIATRSTTFNGQPRQQHGFDLAGSDAFGSVTSGGDFAAEAYWWAPEGTITVLNVWVNNAHAASNASIRVELTSSETSTTVDETLNRTTGILNYNGIQYRQYQSAAPLSPAEITALQNIQDASGGNDVKIDFFDANGNPILFQPEFLWDAMIGQHNLQPFLEVDRADRIMHGARVLADWGVMTNFNDRAAAAADGALTRPYQTWAELDEAARRQDPRIFITVPGYAGSGGTKGAVSGRNKIKFRLIPFSHGSGQYWTSQSWNRRLLQPFDNVTDVSQVDPDRRIGSATLTEGDAQQGATISIPLSAELTTRETVGWKISNRANSAARLDLDFTRAADTAANHDVVWDGRTYRVYTATLTTDQTERLLGTAGWAFTDNEFEGELVDSIAGNNPINFNPDQVQFSRGAGYVAPAGAIAATAVEVTGGGAWVTVYQASSASTIVANVDLTRNIATAHEVRVECVRGGTAANAMLITPPFYGTNIGAPTGSPARYSQRLDFGNYCEFFFTRQSGTGNDVVDRIVRSAGTAGLVYRVQARF